MLYTKEIISTVKQKPLETIEPLLIIPLPIKMKDPPYKILRSCEWQISWYDLKGTNK